MAQPFATVDFPMLLNQNISAHSHSIVIVILFTFLNLSMGIYGKF